MADLLEQLAEARIREWQRRIDAGDVPTARPVQLAHDSWEAQVFKDIVALRLAARQTTSEPERQRLLAEAESLRLQLMTVVERDRPRLAAALAAQLTAATRTEA